MEVSSWLTRSAQRVPDRPAVQSPSGSLTYAELLAAARARAAALHRGERVAIALAPGPPFAVALHACLLAGAIAVPIDARLAPEEQARLTGSARSWSDVPLGAALEPAPHQLDAPVVELHTSGTSGVPKRVRLSYGNLLWSALGSATAIGLDPAERWLSALPVAHVGGLSVLVRSAIYGTTALIQERWETRSALRALQRERVTLMSLVPTMLQRLLDAGLRDPPHLRCALLGGAPAEPTLLARAAAAGVPVSQSYGLTEASSQVCTQRPGDMTPDSGPPLFCTRVALAPDGEILVSGPTIAGSGSLRTGDLGELSDGGRLRVTGRKSDLIISGGENVMPTDVEAVLTAHPRVREAAVVGRPDSEWGEAVCAVVVGDAGEAELREWCRERLAPFKVPKVIEHVESLPRTASGKLLRRAL